MKVTARTALELAHHEGIVRQAYKDSVGVWTWSVGITSASGHSVERYIGKPQPLQKCLEVWLWALEEKYAKTVRRVFSGHNLTEAQFAAALSFHYNTGGIARASWVKKWKAGDIAGARASFMAWKKPKEIIPRRRAERDLFFDGVWTGDGKMTEYTRVRSNGQPDWGSAKRIDVRSAVKSILSGSGATPQPQPAPSEEEDAADPKPARPAAFLAAIVTAVTAWWSGDDKAAEPPPEPPVAEQEQPATEPPACVCVKTPDGFTIFPQPRPERK